ncbi:MAG: DUF1793 domain-containing protein, partial [Acetatifactor sp.]|nr:DUF1793 domain-containing protein [Acetatifactor sp.]
CALEKSADFAKPYMDTLYQWVEYLKKHGEDPSEQLCTDDFAGHLAHNVNLSAKAIVGIESFSQILTLLGKADEAKEYHALAEKMAKSLEERAFDTDHYTLTYGGKGTFSLKYNVVWDKFFGSNLFSKEFTEREIACYIKECNEYGTPLDSRKDYTKSDWILWATALTDDCDDRKKLIAPVAKFLKETNSRFPFSDWYETKEGCLRAFKGRSVQGGIFMPAFIDGNKCK